MLSKKTFVALGLVVVQTVVLIFLLRTPKPGERPKVLPAVSAKDVQKVVLSKGTDTVEMVRKEAAEPPPAPATPDGGAPPARPDPEWDLVKPVAYKADKVAVKQLLDRIEKMNVAPEPISSKKEWHDDKFGVGEKTGWKVELFGQAGSALSTFILGKTKDGRTFLRKADDAAVYAATGIAAYAFDKKPADWRDKTIFNTEEKEIVKVEVKGADQVVLARDPKDEKKWVLEQPQGIKLDRGKAEAVARTFAKLRAKEFGEGEKPDVTGLAAPGAAVTAHFKDGKALTLLVGKKKGQYDQYVKRADKDTVFVIGTFQVDQLARKAADFKEKEPVIAKPEAGDVQRLEVKGPKGHVVIARAGEAWQMTAPLTQAADGNAVKAVLNEIQKMNVPESTHGGKEKHAEYELDDKGLRVEVFGAGGKRLTGFVVGKEDKGQIWLRKAGDPKVYKAYGISRAAFDKAPEAWQSKLVMSFQEADAQAIELEREGGSLRLARAENAWKIEKPKAGAADEKKVKDLLAALANFNAADFAPAAKPEETGLTKPALKISVELKGKGATTLLVGNKTPKGDYFAKRGDGPQVYVLSSWQLPRIDKKFDDLVAHAGAPSKP